MRLKALSIAVAIVSATPALTQTRSQVTGSPLEQQAMTVYMQADLGLNTFESEAADSKESQESTTFTLGGWAGEDRVIGATVTSSTDDVKFDLNDSRSQTNFTDLRVAGRVWIFTPSIGMSLTETDVEYEGVKTVSLYSTGVNAGVGINVPVHDTVVVTGDVMTVQSNKSFDKLDEGTELGERNEANIMASIDVTQRVVDLIVGYKVREYTIKNETTDVEVSEKAQGAYAGLRLGLYF